MKRLFFITVCLLFACLAKAQFVFNDEGRIIPFSKTAKYKNMINTSTVKTCMLKSYNNDSLYTAKNKGNNSEAEIAGISIDTLINLKSAASRYKIDEGTVWLYRIESKTAKMLAITINQLVIPEGAYICIFPKDEELEFIGPKLFLKKDIISPVFWKYHYGNQLYVEYFEPNKVDKRVNINISRIDHMFLPPFKKK
jgi:hypothetical protein